MATKRLKVESYGDGVIITASTYNTGDHIIDYPLGLDSIGKMTDVLNTVFKAGMEAGEMNARVKMAEDDIDRAAELLAERVSVKAKENVCTQCLRESDILHHVKGEPGTALCPRCHALHTEAKVTQAEMAIVTPFDPNQEYPDIQPEDNNA